MIQMYTYLDVADNTGAKECMCIKVLGGTPRRYAGLGDVIIASVKKAIPGGDVKPGDVVQASWCASRSRRGATTAATSASIATPWCMIDKEQNPTRHAHLRGRGPRAARERNFVRIVSLAAEVV